jgi:hypothetical protein
VESFRSRRNPGARADRGSKRLTGPARIGFPAPFGKVHQPIVETTPSQLPGEPPNTVKQRWGALTRLMQPPIPWVLYGVRRATSSSVPALLPFASNSNLIPSQRRQHSLNSVVFHRQPCNHSVTPHSQGPISKSLYCLASQSSSPTSSPPTYQQLSALSSSPSSSNATFCTL